MPQKPYDAESNLYQLKRRLAAERAEDDSIPAPDIASGRNDRHRPLMGGSTISSGNGAYGTLGVPARVTDTDDTPDWAVWADDVSEGEVLLTTNRHVLDGSLGQPVYQPIGDDAERRVGTLVGFCRLGYPAAPDCAFFRPTEGVDFGGYIDAPGMGDSVRHEDYQALADSGADSRLTGATSGTVTGTVTDGTTSVRVNYGGAFGVIEKRGVIAATDNSQGGDSGSPSDAEGALHGLNFASSGGFLEGGASWKVPVEKIEQAGVAVQRNAELTGQANMTELTIDARDTTDERIWFLIDVSGDAELGEYADDYEQIRESPRNSDHLRLSGRVRQGRDSFRIEDSDAITTAGFDGPYGNLVAQVGDETWTPADFPGWDRDAPESTDDPYPDGLPDGGYRVGDDDAPVWDILGARGRDRSPEHTTHPIYLYLHPEGDDSAAGSKTAPLASLREALRRLPMVWCHAIQILVAPGDYHNPGSGGLTLGGRTQDYFTASRKGFNVIGLGDSPDDTTFSGYRQFNFNINANGSYGNVCIEDCALETTVTADRGAFGLENVIVNPTRSDGVAVAGYGGDGFLQGVEFGSRTATAVKCKEGSEFILNQCSGSVSEDVVAGSAGTVRGIWENSIDSPADGWGATLHDEIPIDVVRGVER